MKKLLALLLLALPSWASFSYTVGPVHANVTHATARVMVSTSALTTARVVWDTSSHANCAAYPVLNSDSDGATHGTHNWFIGGLTASTTYFYRWCANDGSGETSSSEDSFTTGALPSPHPAPATLPLVTPGFTSPPTVTGSTWIVGNTSGSPGTAPNCGGSHLLADCWGAAQCGDIYGHTDKIVIPAALPQDTFSQDPSNNPYLPTKACSATNPLLVTSDNAMPSGRISPSSESTMAVIVADAFGHYDATTTITNANCFPGGYNWSNKTSPGTPGFYMQQCVQNGTTQTITNITGGSFGGDTFGVSHWSGLVTTASAHGFSVNDNVFIAGVVGIARANGSCRVTAVPTSTTANVTCASAYFDTSNTYSSGGTIVNHVWQTITLGSGTANYQNVSLSLANTTCSPLGAWGYDSTSATENYDGAVGPKVAVASTGSVMRCSKDTRGNVVWKPWRVLLKNNNGTKYWGLAVDSSSYIYFLGIHFTRTFSPTEPLFLRDGADASQQSSSNTYVSQGGKLSEALVGTTVNSSNITFDRCWFDGIGYPNGATGAALTLNGDNISVINSYGSGLGNWFGATDRGARYDNFAAAAIVRSAGTGFLFLNTYWEAYGISLHHDDSEAAVLNNQDITVKKNWFFRALDHFYGSVTNLLNFPEGVYWPLRQLYEHKAGLRILLDGNIFQNNWRNVSQAAAIALTPRMEVSPWFQFGATATSNTIDWGSNIPVTNLVVNSWLVCTVSGLDQLYQVTATPTTHSATVASIPNGFYVCARADWPGGVQDLTISNNTFTGVPNAISVFGTVSPDTTTVGSANIGPLQRITLNNNLYYNILDDDPQGGPAGSQGDPNIWQSSGGGYVSLNPHPFGFDIISNHETHYSIAGEATAILNISGSGFFPNVEGVKIQNNISSMRDPSTCPVPGNCALKTPLNGNGGSGTAFISASVVNGVVQCNWYGYSSGGNPGGYGSPFTTINWVASNPSGFLFVNPGTGNFALQGGSLGKAGGGYSCDGNDVGVDMVALLAAQGNSNPATILTGKIIGYIH